MLKNYFRTIWRNIQKNLTTSLINIGGLSIGMTAAIFIFLWVQNELSFDNFHKDADHIYRISTHLKTYGWSWESTPLLLAGEVKKEIPEISDATRAYNGNVPIFTVDNKPSFEKKCAYVDPNWFSMFHYDFVEGDAASFAKDPNSVILTVSDARKYFGKTNVVGATIRADSTNLVVRAVIKDAPANLSFQYNSFIPLAIYLKNKDVLENDMQWGNDNYLTFVRLKSTANTSGLDDKLTKLFRDRAHDNEVTLGLSSLMGMHFDTEFTNSVFVHGSKQTVYIFSVLAIFLLLIACINYVNLTTARAGLRAKEVSVRKIIGANRAQLFYQFMTEALLVSFFALVLTVFLVQLCLPAFNALTNKTFTLGLTDVNMWKVIGATLLGAFLLNSIYPALTLSSLKPLSAFKGFTFLKIKDSFFRKGLVVFQFTVSIVLIAGTIVIYRQMKFIQETNPGYNKSQVMGLYLPAFTDGDNKASVIESIKQELLKQSSIQNVSVSNQAIVDIGSYSAGAADYDGHDTTFNPKIAQLSVDADYAKTLQLQMAEGRFFQAGNESDKNNVILNETAIEVLRIHKPFVGQRFKWKGRTGQIIGVVKDFKYGSLRNKTGPLVMFVAPNWYHQLAIRVAPGNVEQGVKAVQATWQKFFPGTPMDYSFLDETFNNLYASDQQTSQLMLVFALIAVFISSLGLFTLAAFTAEQKAKEIGVRKVLGASVAGITQLLTRSFLKLVLIALIIAAPIAWIVMNKWLQDFAYRINVNAWMIAGAGFIAMLIALFTISFQAIKAAMANPVKSLRAE